MWILILLNQVILTLALGDMLQTDQPVSAALVTAFFVNVLVLLVLATR